MIAANYRKYPEALALQLPLPFGPFLAAAGWLALLWGETITHTYLRWLGA